MNKCPACGYKISDSYNISTEIAKLMNKRNKRTRKYLNKIASKVTSNLHFETRINYFRFLFGIQSIDDHVVEWGIEQYYQKRYYTSGKGFAYLRKIIQNRNQNIGVLKKNEREMLGSPPPVREIEE